MDIDVFNNPFGTQSITPDFGTLQTKGTSKLLVVIFVVDCSKTMSGDRIGAVNAAMQELKYKLTEIKNDNSLDLRIAIMSFASSAKWELELTPIEEVNLETIHTRPGLTEYGAAFHELNKVLRKESYMKYTGKISPPAIMFLTDGEPEDDYQLDLDELLKNGWFSNASRSVVLLGDAINNSSARDAVKQFVNDADSDIVTAEDSTVIIQKIKIATMHSMRSVAGNPMRDDSSHAADTPVGGGTSNDVNGGKNDPFGIFETDAVDDPFGSTSGTATSDDGTDADTGDSTSDNSFDNTDAVTTSKNNDPFDETSTDNPFGNDVSDDLFGDTGVDTDNPFDDSNGGDDPFAGSDPFVGEDDSFGGLI
jgi:hypothetical protein